MTVKVGLSRISVALHGSRGIVAIRSAPTPPPGGGAALEDFFSSLWPGFSHKGLPVALVCVVPDLAPHLAEPIKKRFGVVPRPFDLASAPFSFEDYAGGLGADRGAALWGAVVRHGKRLGPSFMVADFGTHTVTTVLCRGRLLGGTIMPGITLTMGAVGAGRVLLGQEAPPRREGFGIEELRLVAAVGRGTREGILAGAVLGGVAAVEGLRSRAEKEVGEPLGLILTGGLSPLLARFFSGDPPVDRQLLHYGARCFLPA